MTTPKLPAAVVGVLGALATFLAASGDLLPSPYDAIATGVLGVLSLLGVVQTQRTVARHGAASRALGRAER